MQDFFLHPVCKSSKYKFKEGLLLHFRLILLTVFLFILFFWLSSSFKFCYHALF